LWLSSWPSSRSHLAVVAQHATETWMADQQQLGLATALAPHRHCALVLVLVLARAQA
jgi:hypothetical protein